MVIGLTGGMGCGKSTAGAIFMEFGFGFIDTDQIVRDLLNEESEVLLAVREHFGDKVCDHKGKVDRGKIAGIVFSETAELKWLEALLHPRVRKRWQKQIDGDTSISWVVEVPLLFEKKLEKYFDFTVCVSTSPKNQLARREARGLSENQIKARIALQWPLGDKIIHSDFVLSNNGPTAFIRQQILLLNERLNIF